jgi:hypothetical protein
MAPSTLLCLLACVMLSPAGAFLLAGPACSPTVRGRPSALAALRCQEQVSVAVEQQRGRSSRRELLQGAAAAAVLGAPPASWAEYGSDVAGGLELIVPQEKLLGALTSAPVRNVIITGANSGVGLAAAKLLTASGHHVTLACRTQVRIAFMA